ncbi:MAG: hypothetical protein GY851_08250, partial [bacterium]|nr:hypothetical protein [bacterium]
MLTARDTRVWTEAVLHACLRPDPMEESVMADDEAKIFIDEDWKAQVQREKEKAKEEA